MKSTLLKKNAKTYVKLATGRLISTHST